MKLRGVFASHVRTAVQSGVPGFCLTAAGVWSWRRRESVILSPRVRRQQQPAPPSQGRRRAWEERVAEAPPGPERANPLLSSPRPDGRPRGGLLPTEALKVQLLLRAAEGRPTAVTAPPTTVLGIFCAHAQSDLKITRSVGS